MTGRDFDIAIAGGGLSGGLIAAALARYRPDVRVVLVEAGENLGGSRRWSWFARDLSPEGEELLRPFRKTEWDAGCEVHFPTYRRALRSGYCSLDSGELDAALRRQLPADAIRVRRSVVDLDAQGMTLASGERITARAVIDCRGFAPTPLLRGGWRVFMGRYLRTPTPHGLARPVIMDARVEQRGACRFVHVLPLAAHELLVEDICYADTPVPDRSAQSRRIDEYCADQGWDGEILGGEAGVLPVVTGGNFAAFQAAQRAEGVAVAGGRGGFIHPLTAGSLPLAVEVALAVAAEADLPGDQLSALLEARARRHWSRSRFYRRLGRMLFGTLRPEERWRMFARVYRHPAALVERFHAGRSTRADRMRILFGGSPAGLPAFGMLAGKGAPLTLTGGAPA